MAAALALALALEMPLRLAALAQAPLLLLLLLLPLLLLQRQQLQALRPRTGAALPARSPTCGLQQCAPCATRGSPRLLPLPRQQPLQPLALLRGRPCLVVGGGQLGRWQLRAAAAAAAAQIQAR